MINLVVAILYNHAEFSEWYTALELDSPTADGVSGVGEQWRSGGNFKLSVADTVMLSQGPCLEKVQLAIGNIVG